MRFVLGPALVLFVGCKPPPPEAPLELDELVAYLYEHVPDEDPAALEVGAENLAAWLDARLDETLEGYTVSNLSSESVVALGEGEKDLEELAGAAVGHESGHDVESLSDAQVGDDPMDVYPDNYDAYERDELTDLGCFLDGECEFHEAESWGSMNYPFIVVETHSMLQYRRIETPHGTAVFERTWLREPAAVNVDWLDVEQQYYLWAAIPTENGARSIQVTWVVARLGDSAVDKDIALNMVISSMQGLAEDLDTWVDGK